MKLLRYMIMAVIAIAAAASTTSCNDRKSYAELLTDETMAVNSFLVNHRVVGYEERDSTFQFQVGPEAPYYQMDQEGNIYMQVLNAGTPGNRAKYDQLIYFRFTRYNLGRYENGQLPSGEGNDQDLTNGSTSFRYANMQVQASYQWGTGLQVPLNYLPIDCEVNIIIKSQLGLYSEIANVIPYLYNVRYFKSQI